MVRLPCWGRIPFPHVPACSLERARTGGCDPLPRCGAGPDPPLAGHGAGRQGRPSPREGHHGAEGRPGRRRAGDPHRQCLGSHDLPLSAARGQGHGRGRPGVPGRGLQHPRDGPRGHGGLRVAELGRRHRRAPEVPRSQARGAAPERGAAPGRGARHGAHPYPRFRVGHRPGEGGSARVLPQEGTFPRPLPRPAGSEAILQAGRGGPTPAAGRISRSSSIPPTWSSRAAATG